MQIGVAQPFDRTLYVDREHPSASDSNPGTLEEPLLTIQEAMDRAQDHKNDGLSTRVSIGAGVYREAVQFAYSNYNGGGTNAAVVVEGAGPEETVISGSEVFTDWTNEGGGVFSHEWTKDWGITDDPTGGYIDDCSAHPTFCADTPELVLRREMVFIVGERMRQVLSAGAMEPGAFYVDESADKLYLKPPVGVDLSDALVEVAVREEGWMTRSENNFTLRSLRVEHAATPWVYGRAAVTVSGDNNTIEDVAIVQNNYNGLRPRGKNVTLRNFTLDRNGASGLVPYKVIDFLAESGQVNRNNWRGALGGYTGWSVGNKAFAGHGLTVRQVEFNHNLSRGLWLDTDLKDVLLEDVEVRNNLRDNIWVERTQGPVTLRRVESTGSAGYGIALVNAVNTMIVDSRFMRNDHGGIHISGDEGGVQISDFKTGETMRVETRELTLTRSIISGVGESIRGGGGDGRFLIGTTFTSTWDDFVATYEGNYNTWFESERSDAFEWTGGELITLEEWQSRIGQDHHSIFHNPGDTATQHIPLHSGWNMISGRINPATPALENVWSDLEGDLVLLKDERGSTYLPVYAINSIGDWSPSKAYQAYVEHADTLTLTGQTIDPATASIALKGGWNLVPHYKRTPEPVEDAFASIADALVIVKNGMGKTYVPGESNNTLRVMRPGHGYKVLVSEDVLLTFPIGSN